MSSRKTESSTQSRSTFFERLSGRRRRFAATAVVLAVLMALGGTTQAGPLDSLLDLVRAIKKSVQTIVNRLPNDPKTRNLAGKFDTELIGGLSDLVDNVREDALEVVKLMKRENARITSFENGGGPARVRSHLDSMLLDLKGIAVDTQKLGCLIDPRYPQVPVSVGLMRDAIDFLPPIALYGVESVLNEIDPDWPMLLADLHDAIPTEVAAPLCGMELAEFEQERCAVIESVPSHDWSYVQMQIGYVSTALGIVKEFTPESVEVTLGAVAVGGAAAGGKVDLPLKAIINAIEVSLGELNNVIDLATGVQDTCYEVGDRMERDLLSCTALVSYEEDFDAVQSLAQRRLESIGDYQAAYAVEQASDFAELCDTYRGFRLGQ